MAGVEPDGVHLAARLFVVWFVIIVSASSPSCFHKRVIDGGSEEWCYKAARVRLLLLAIATFMGSIVFMNIVEINWVFFRIVLDLHFSAYSLGVFGIG